MADARAESQWAKTAEEEAQDAAVYQKYTQGGAQVGRVGVDDKQYMDYPKYIKRGAQNGGISSDYMYYQTAIVRGAGEIQGVSYCKIFPLQSQFIHDVDDDAYLQNINGRMSQILGNFAFASLGGSYGQLLDGGLTVQHRDQVMKVMRAAVGGHSSAGEESYFDFQKDKRAIQPSGGRER
jgi:hypothetical protein